MICAIEFLGPCRFAGWAVKDIPSLGIMRGEPVAKENPAAWVQVAAVSLTQTKNTMKIFPGLFNDACKRRHEMNKQSIGKTVIYAHRGQRQIEAVTSSPSSLEGNRGSFVVRNEALALDTPIPAPGGWTTMGALRDGDVIFGDDGHSTVVTKAHPVQTDRRCFEVTFWDGTSIIASDGHWWQTKPASSAAKPKRRTTLEMFEDGRRFMVPRAGQRVTKPTELSVDPYLLGAWLGDGSTGACNITVSADDLPELQSQLAARGVESRVLATQIDRAPRITFSKKSGYQASTAPASAVALRRLPCFRDKHIPRAYLEAGTEQRLELLRGLMDTDGHMAAKNRAIFVGRKRLTHDVLELLRSLGQVATATFAPDPRSREGGSWRVSFTPRDIQPFSMPRKAALVGQAKRDWVPITSIREVASVPVRCISVDSPTHLFQAGEAGHVTSNTHHWMDNNSGTEMAAVLERNSTKSKGGAARALSITNAFEPGQESVAEVARRAYEAEASGQAINTGVLYDSLEVGMEVGLMPPEAKKWHEPADDAEALWQENVVRAYLRTVLSVVRGDSWWLDIVRLTNSILDGANPPSRSRRFWLNQIVSSEDAWVDPAAVDAGADPIACSQRKEMSSGNAFGAIEAGWLVLPTDPIVCFFDGSKSDDSTAIVGCRLSDGYTFLIGVWAKPTDAARAKGWLVDRSAVDIRVEAMFKRFNVVAFWADPSHTLDDDNTRFWDGYIDGWHQRYGDRLQAKFWSIKTGPSLHSIMWDMTSPERHKLFVGACELVRSEIMHKPQEDDENFSPLFTHDGHPALKQHLKNAKATGVTLPGGMLGVTIRKTGRESPDKIDIAACVIGARMLRRIALNVGLEVVEEQGGWAYSA